MNLSTLSRRLALRIPRVKRYYDYVNTLAAEQSSLLQKLEAASRTESSLLKKLEAASTIEGEVRAEAFKVQAALKAQRDDLELQLYTLRADHQRTVRVADHFRSRLQDAETAKAALASEIQALAERLAECDCAPINPSDETDSARRRSNGQAT